MTKLRRVPLDDVRAACARDQVPAWILRVPQMSEEEMADLRARWPDVASGPVRVAGPEWDRDFFLTAQPRRGEDIAQRALDRYVARTRVVGVRRSWWWRLLGRWAA